MDGSSTFSNKLKEGMRKISMCRNNEMQVKVKVEHLQSCEGQQFRVPCRSHPLTLINLYQQRVFTYFYTCMYFSVTQLKQISDKKTSIRGPAKFCFKCFHSFTPFLFLTYFFTTLCQERLYIYVHIWLSLKNSKKIQEHGFIQYLLYWVVFYAELCNDTFSYLVFSLGKNLFSVVIFCLSRCSTILLLLLLP